ncbi:alpha/beta hydrolase [bacterium]|nr:alpha/beta hydrolase [bacterium]QQR57768.1 MAG: alpha/beta hydrolase [Candidatus Melainabacteria bacterium]
MRTRSIRVSILALIVACFLCPPSIAESKINDKQNVIAKIFYVTSRKWNGKSFTSDRGDATKHSFGSCKVHFPTNDTRWDMRNYLESLEAIGWEVGQGSKSWETTDVWRNENFEKFLEGLRPAVNQTGELIIYVHGYHNAFEDSTKDAAILSSYLKMPVIAYSWPTPKTLSPTPRNYNIAQNDVTWSQQPFTDFVGRIIKEFPQKTISIVCHSMGSRLVIGTLHDLFPSGGNVVLKEIAFASADYDSATFVNRVGPALGAAERTRLYISPKDKAIAFSQWLVGNQTRMGSPGDSINMITSLPNTEVVDFTTYGGGITGHSIAHWLVANMHKYGKPGGEWALQRQALRLVKTTK